MSESADETRHIDVIENELRLAADGDPGLAEGFDELLREHRMAAHAEMSHKPIQRPGHRPDDGGGGLAPPPGTFSPFDHRAAYESLSASLREIIATNPDERTGKMLDAAVNDATRAGAPD